ncbi:MAG: hypothetical protein KGJ23_11460 [Euryarchaeota archaeon]|nr:hypothetical protein [Euryarchaeota archaeon]MDE1881422.1 hypothetical protein [Euryarchaeota archaeon]MDE2045368.1 hypothetical protein [Thermoplasmata archaeon]
MAPPPPDFKDAHLTEETWQLYRRVHAQWARSLGIPEETDPLGPGNTRFVTDLNDVCGSLARAEARKLSPADREAEREIRRAHRQCDDRRQHARVECNLRLLLRTWEKYNGPTLSGRKGGQEPRT